MRLEDIVQLVAEHGAERHVKRAGIALPLTIGALLPGAARQAMDRATDADKKLQDSADRSNTMGKMAAGPAGPSGQSGPQGRHMSSPGLQSSMLSSLLGGAMVGQVGKPSGPAGMLGSLGQLGGSPIGGVAQGISGGISERIKRMLMGREYGELKDPMHMMGTKAIESFGSEAGKAGIGLLKDIANKAMDAAGHSGDEAAREAIIGNLKRTDSVLSAADDGTLMEAYNTMKRFAPTLSTDKNAVRSFLRQAVMSGSGPDFMAIKLLSDAEKSVNWEKGVR